MMRDLPQGPRVRFREITPDDAYTVTRWRNSESARRAFFSDELVTPDRHRAFCLQRAGNDLVWMVELEHGEPIGMLSLIVDGLARTGEYGRAFLDPAYRGHGYWLEVEWLLLSFAFDTLGLEQVWLDIFADNEAMNGVHAKYGWKRGGRSRIERNREVIQLYYSPETWAERREAMRQEVAGRAAGTPAYTTTTTAAFHVGGLH